MQLKGLCRGRQFQDKTGADLISGFKGNPLFQVGIDFAFVITQDVLAFGLRKTQAFFAPSVNTYITNSFHQSLSA